MKTRLAWLNKLVRHQARLNPAERRVFSENLQELQGSITWLAENITDGAAQPPVFLICHPDGRVEEERKSGQKRLQDNYPAAKIPLRDQGLKRPPTELETSLLKGLLNGSKATDTILALFMATPS